MLSTSITHTAPTAPPSSTLLHHQQRRRRRRYLNSHLYNYSPSSFSSLSSLSSSSSSSLQQKQQKQSFTPSSPLRFDRQVPPPSPPTLSSPTMADYHHVRSGSLNIPSQGVGLVPPAPASQVQGQQQGRFDGPRSPPSMSPPHSCSKCILVVPDSLSLDL